MSAQQTTQKKRRTRAPSISDLYDRMVANGSRMAAANTALDDGPTVPMSVRVPPAIKSYYEAQAKACGAASASAMVAMVLHGVMLSTQEQARD